MFKAFSIYRIGDDALPQTRDDLERALQALVFTPCGATEPMRIGFVPALSDKATAMVAAHGTTAVVRVAEQRRVVPAAALREAVAEKAAQREKAEGRPLGRKEKQRLKDDVRLDMLPRAFTVTRDLRVLFIPGFVLVGTRSESRATAALNLLRLALGSFPVRKVETGIPVPTMLTGWMTSKSVALPEGFALGSECELTDSEDKIRCVRVDPQSDELQALVAGHEVTRLGLTYNGLRFAITHGLRFVSLKLEGHSQPGDNPEEEADTEWQLWALLMTVVLQKLLPLFGERQ